LYRDRDFFEQDTSNLTSGRDEIWLYYGHMLENSSLLELLFGRGAIWEYGSLTLAAHNDLLSLMVCYGLAGTTAVLYAWYVILSRLDPEYRIPCVALFLVLFFTNGVVFHQSNLLFVLFMAGKAQGAVAELVGIEGGVVSGVINLESSGVEASDWRPRHDEHYHEVCFLAASGRDSFPTFRQLVRSDRDRG